MEYRLLEYLAMRCGKGISETAILEHPYDFNSERFSNVVAVYVSALRRRYEPEPPYKLLLTLRGQGYRLGEPEP